MRRAIPWQAVGCEAWTRHGCERTTRCRGAAPRRSGDASCARIWQTIVVGLAIKLEASGGSHLTKDSRKILSPHDECASNEESDLSEDDKLAKRKNRHIFYIRESKAAARRDRDEGGRGQKIVDENGDAANEPTGGSWLDLRSWVWNLMLRQIIKTK